jgi:hypothetical protein
MSREQLLVSRHTFVRAEIIRLTQCLPEHRKAAARKVFDLLDDDVKQWWRHHPERPGTATGPEFKQFRDRVFEELFVGLIEMPRGSDSAFPFLFMTTLASAMEAVHGTLNGREPRNGARAPHQFPATFVSGLMVHWYADRLSKKQRTALELRFIQELSIPEIAEAMKYGTEASVRSMLRMGIAKVRQLALTDAKELRRRRQETQAGEKRTAEVRRGGVTFRSGLTAKN